MGVLENGPLQMPINGYSNPLDYQSTLPVYASHHVVPGSQLSTPRYQLNLDGTYVFHQDTDAHPTVGSPFMLNNAIANSTAIASNTFRLHRNDVSSCF